VGSRAEVDKLRDAGREYRDRSLLVAAQSLARRLAPSVVVQDLGRVRLEIGTRVVEGSTMRRKVLSLLCLLITKIGFTASRENVIEELWPDQEPDAALNSLNQTVYFLRRVFEPEYDERVSPGYVRQDGESIWLDRDLVSSRSQLCLSVLRDSPGNGSITHARQIGDLYSDRFALDFPYEEWATAFRESLHAGYLRVMEQAIAKATTSGDPATAIELAERVHAVDPEAEEVLASLVSLYRVSGAHAAAAERYQRYAATLRDLGVQPESLSSL
jgi:DNA-binding SARP family transcriptional activator